MVFRSAGEAQPRMFSHAPGHRFHSLKPCERLTLCLNTQYPPNGSPAAQSSTATASSSTPRPSGTMCRVCFSPAGLFPSPKRSSTASPGLAAADVAEELALLSYEAQNDQKPDTASAEYAEHHERVMKDLLTTEHEIISSGVDLIEGAQKFLGFLSEHMPVAVASNSTANILNPENGKLRLRPAGAHLGQQQRRSHR